MTSPRLLLTLGLILLITSWIIPLLIIMNVMQSTFMMNFLAWSASVSGLFLGFLGGAMWVKMDKDE